jgi:hypothetical protein
VVCYLVYICIYSYIYKQRTYILLLRNKHPPTIPPSGKGAGDQGTTPPQADIVRGNRRVEGRWGVRSLETTTSADRRIGSCIWGLQKVESVTEGNIQSTLNYLNDDQ